MVTKAYMRVNNDELVLDDVHALMQMLDGYDVRASFKYHFAILEYAKSQNISLETSDLQTALDEYRHELGLERGAAFEQWRIKQRITDEALRFLCEINAYKNKIKKAITRQELQDLLSEIVEDETTYSLYGLTLDNKEKAEQIANSIRNDMITFSEAIAKYGDEESRKSSGFLGEIAQSDLPEDHINSLISIKPGMFIGPFLEEGNQWSLVYMEDKFVPVIEDLEEELRDVILDQKFEHFVERTVIMDAEA